MSKRITTSWYIVAWVAWAVAVTVPLAIGHGAALAYSISTVAGLVAFVMWIGALVKLAQQRAWAWFAAVLVLQVVFLGIVGMVAYAIAGPNEAEDVAIRPTTT